MINRTTLFSTIARFVSSAQEKQQRAHSRAFSLRLSAVLNRLQPGDELSENIFILARADLQHAHKFNEYVVVGVDGSQVYPDRSFASGVCGIINIGGIVLNYGAVASSADFFAATTLVSKADMPPGLVFCPEVIDTLRALRELEVGLEKMLHLKQQGQKNTLLMLDGSMIPYGLMLKNTVLQQFFATRFLAVLQQLYEHQLPLVWYISAPQSLMLARTVGEEEQTDAQLLDEFLNINKITPIFALNQKTLFGVGVRPEYATSFFYAKKGAEVARVECPSWVMNSVDVQKLVFGVVFDQGVKGFGYPVALTEAHRQALITEKDRDFVLRQLELEGFELPGGAIKATRKHIIPA